jgi:hypothetical protein
MSFNWNKLVNIANGLTSPKQTINMLLNQIAKKDKTKAEILRKMINDGRNASDVLVEISSKGEISLDQLSEIKKIYNVLRKLGLKQQIPNEIWINAEQAIRKGISNKKVNKQQNIGVSGF